MPKTPDQIIRMIGTTSGSRFRAAERLARKDRFNNAVSVYTSVALIILSVVTIAYGTSKNVQSLSNVLSIGLSIIVLAFSSLQYAGNYGVNAELMHRCALEINEIRRRLEIKSIPWNQDDLENAIRDYDAVLARYPINHEEVDHWGYKLDKWWTFEDLNAEYRDSSGNKVGMVTSAEAKQNRANLRRRVFLASYSRLVVGMCFAIASGLLVAYLSPALT